MSWSGIASNQTVSCNNLQDGVNTGVFIPLSTIPVSQKQITKTEASSYVAINTSYPSFSSKSATQLVVKSDLDPLLYSNRIYGVDDANVPLNGAGLPTDGYVIYSSDSGSTWSSTFIYGFSVSRSGRGQYVLTGYWSNNAIAVSSDYGVTWTARSCTMSLAPLPSVDFYMTGTCVSDSGQYMYICCQDSNETISIGKSSDYGVTWTNVYYSSQMSSGQPVILPTSKIACSGDGKYVTTFLNLQNASFSWGYRLYKSSDYGVSWNASGFTSLRYWTDVAINTSGQYQLLSQMSGFGTGNTNGEGRIYLSSNYGASFIEKTYDQYDRALYCDMSENGQYMLVALVNTNNTLNKFYYSTNYGVSFSSFNTNPPIPAIGQTPGGVFVSSDGTYALITYIDSAQITYTNNWSTWTTVSIPTAYTFGGLSKSRFLDIPGTTTTTTTPSPSSYNYYDVTRFNCPTCSGATGGYVARNNTTGGILTNGYYYNNGDGYVYRIDGYNAGPSYTIDLDGSASDIDCSTACSI
jgi:hypothetical protein